MHERDNIFAVYKYITKNNADSSEASYYLIRVFDNLGPVSTSEMQRIYRESFPDNTNGNEKYVGPFNNLSVLKQFSFNLLEALDGDKICLISLADFNSLLDCVVNAQELSKNMLEIGDIIENIEKDERKQSFFAKMLK